MHSVSERMTTHGTLRFQQRGVSARIADLVYRYAENEEENVCGRIRIWLSSSQKEELLALGVSPGDFEQALRITLIISPDEWIVTVLMRTPKQPRKMSLH